MLEYDNRQAARPLGDAKLTDQSRWLAVVVACKKLLVSKGQCLDRPQFGSRSQVLGSNLCCVSGR
jgi:hypothetical protein